MTRFLLILVVSIHLILVALNLVAIPFLAVNEPWYVSIPLISFLIRLATVERLCPLTIVENYLRRSLGMKEIRTFIGHYIVKRIYMLVPTTKPTRVVHLKKEPYDVRIDRASEWGNPFFIGKHGTREQVIEKYRQWLLTQPELLGKIHTLKGKTLGCWCAPQKCHGDVLVELAERT